MIKPRVRILDNHFAHCASLGSGDLMVAPEKVEFVRSDTPIGKVVIVTDSHWDQVEGLTETVKIGMIVEPRCIRPEPYERAKSMLGVFDFILTYDQELIKSDKRFLPYYFGGSWVFPKDQKIWPKSKEVSIIVSAKREAEGHKLRHSIIERYGDKVDVFGRGTDNPINGPDLLPALKDYRYNIVVENERSDFWLTEKILSPMVCGCVAIYWGMPSIYDHFSRPGIITFDHIEELGWMLDNMVSEDDYNDRLPALHSNMKIAEKFALPEDWIYEKYLKHLL